MDEPRTLREAIALLAATRRELERTRERAEAADRAKSEFMANVSHEIRTPMNAILGFTGLLMKEPLTDDQMEKLRQVQEAGNTLLRLINNTLDFAKLAAGQLKLSRSTFHVEAVIREVLAGCRDEAREKGLVLQHHVAEAVPDWLQGDKVRFRQVLVNLLDNAIKFTKHGSIYVQVVLDEQTDETATLRVMVTDTGVGIAAQRQTAMFESFSQADGSSTRQFGGLGLGLAVCKQLVDLMGGQIGFRSQPGQGSSFWLTLMLEKHRGRPPVRELPAPAEAESDEVVPADARARGGKPRALVAVPDQLNRTLAEMFLVRAGCLVDLAGGGHEASAMLRKTPYDVVLIDVEMPEMDALETIRDLRRRESGQDGRAWIIALTPQATPGVGKRSLDAGADEFLPKPFSPEALVGSVWRRLHRISPAPDSKPVAGGGKRADPPHVLEEQLRALGEALEAEDFHDLEDSVGRP